MAKPPKKTPNLEWSSMDKGLSVFKTSIQKKLVGGKERNDVPQTFLEQVARVKQLTKLLESLISAAKHCTKSYLAITDAASLWAQSLKEWAAVLPPDDVLSPALVKFHDIIVENEAHRAIYKDQFISALVGAMEKFILSDINEFKEARKQWKKARLEHDAAKAKIDATLKAAQTKPPEAIALLMAQNHYHTARRKETLRFEVVLDKVGDVLWLRDFSLLQQVVEFMLALHHYTEATYNSLYQVEEYLGQLKEHVTTRKADWQALKDSKIAEKKAKELEDFNNRYIPLVELLSAEDLALVNAVCVTAGSEQEVILESLVNILDAHKMTLPIIKLGISKEVEKTSNASTLFRGNTMATKLMTAFTRQTGRSYLANTLKPQLDAVAQDLANGVGYEVDPEKLASGESSATNMTNLKRWCQCFLQAIIDSFPYCPLPFRVMACHLRTEVIKSFSEAKYSWYAAEPISRVILYFIFADLNGFQLSVGGFIFLRFFCPAILSPDSTSPPLMVKVDQNLRRALILISKSLQNLANGLDFGNKEPFMQDMNDFIKDNTPAVQSFFDKLAQPVDKEDYEPLCAKDVAVTKELPALHTKIVQNLEKIGKSLSQYKQEETIPVLAVLLAELGEEGIVVTQDDKKKKK